MNRNVGSLQQPPPPKWVTADLHLHLADERYRVPDADLWGSLIRPRVGYPVLA